MRGRCPPPAGAAAWTVTPCRRPPTGARRPRAGSPKPASPRGEEATLRPGPANPTSDGKEVTAGKSIKLGHRLILALPFPSVGDIEGALCVLAPPSKES